MKQFIVSEEVFAKLPEYCLGVVCVTGFDRAGAADAIAEMLDQAVADFAARHAEDNVREIYKFTGKTGISEKLIYGMQAAIYSGDMMRLYKKLKVRLWKDKVWELGGLGGFSKKRLASPDDPAYIEKFIIECNKGVVVHRLSYFIGFLAMLTLTGVSKFSIALPVALVNLYLNILPTLALRYNTPKLKSMLARMRRIREE